MAPSNYLDVTPSAERVSLQAVATRMFSLMLRNMATDDFVFVDPGPAGTVSAPGCILASPTYPDPPVPAGRPGPQDYLFNWTRDAAIAALELTAPSAPLTDSDRAERLRDYVAFAQTCQAHPANDGRPDDFARACFTLEGTPRPWGNQSDGPALQAIALLAAASFLEPQVRADLVTLVDANVQFLLKAYEQPTLSLWEEEGGNSFFARAVQLRCLGAVRDNTIGFEAPPAIDDAIQWLKEALPRHWSDAKGCYLSFEPPWLPNPLNDHDPYDPNIDIVLAAVYGASPVAEGGNQFLDPRLLASAAAVRAIWTTSDQKYNINDKDKPRGFGPLLGRYPSDYYDGDTNDPRTPGHPWSLCTSAFAELYYRVATALEPVDALPSDPLTTAFLDQVEGSKASPTDAANALRAAGDAMLRGLIFHSDNLELSEQFDRDTGFQRSIRNLTWSYASFLSAVRARSQR